MWLKWAGQRDLLPRVRQCQVPRNEALRAAEACLVSRNQAMYNDLALLRHKLRAIQSELGETQGEMEERWFRDIERRLDEAELPPEARAAADRELGRLRRMNRQSSEAATTRNYLDWLASLPWSAATESPDELDIAAARRLLDEQHYGLKRVKKRVLEYLSVRKLAPDKRGPILCLAGPPGVGKTSLARSIAQTLGRQFVREESLLVTQGDGLVPPPLREFPGTHGSREAGR